MNGKIMIFRALVRVESSVRSFLIYISVNCSEVSDCIMFSMCLAQ